MAVAMHTSSLIVLDGEGRLLGVGLLRTRQERLTRRPEEATRLADRAEGREGLYASRQGRHPEGKLFCFDLSATTKESSTRERLATVSQGPSRNLTTYLTDFSLHHEGCAARRDDGYTPSPCRRRLGIRMNATLVDQTSGGCETDAGQMESGGECCTSAEAPKGVLRPLGTIAALLYRSPSKEVLPSCAAHLLIAKSRHEDTWTCGTQTPLLP